MGAKFGHSQAIQRFEVSPNLLASVIINPNIIRSPGGAASATVTLIGPAPPSGKTIYLSSSNPQRVSVPAAVTVPGGKQSVSVNLATAANNLNPAQVQITASLRRPPSVGDAVTVAPQSSSWTPADGAVQSAGVREGEVRQAVLEIHNPVWCCRRRY